MTTDLTERWDRAHSRYQEHDEEVRGVITWIEASRDEIAERERERRAGDVRGPLHGVLVTLKDNIDTAGVRTTSGAPFLADNVPDADAAAVVRLKDAGAVIVAKVNMAEVAWGATTQNNTYGACRNPWDLSRIPGGSSGGSGAALAAGYCDLSLGTDTGASVRVPASVNGVVGLRPSVGLIPNRGVAPNARSLDTIGPMGRTAELVAHATAAVSGFDRLDPFSRRTDGPTADARLGRPIAGLRIGVPEDFFFEGLDRGVASRIDEALAWAERRGAILVPVPDFGAEHAFEHWTCIVQAEGASHHESRLRSRPEEYSADVRARLSAGLEIAGTELARSIDWRAAYRRRLEGVFESLDLIATPVVPTDVPFATGSDSREQTKALGRITYPWALHAGPTLSLPVGFHADSGMPVGMALAAGIDAESTIFQFAAAYQAETDWHEREAKITHVAEAASAPTGKGTL